MTCLWASESRPMAAAFKKEMRRESSASAALSKSAFFSKKTSVFEARLALDLDLKCLVCSASSSIFSSQMAWGSGSQPDYPVGLRVL